MNDERLIRLPQVESLTGLRRAHIYGLARRGQFPRPIKIGTRASAWRLSQVADWVTARIRESSEVAREDHDATQP
jgi:prophage regulatory protein